MVALVWRTISMKTPIPFQSSSRYSSTMITLPPGLTLPTDPAVALEFSRYVEMMLRGVTLSYDVFTAKDDRGWRLLPFKPGYTKETARLRGCDAFEVVGGRGRWAWYTHSITDEWSFSSLPLPHRR